MELGQRIKQARLEAGLSQRQLCQDLITRNMLSQIENGSAKPSMDTLQKLAARLGRSAGWFLDQQDVQLPNQSVMERARRVNGIQRLQILKDYQGPDPVFDPERWLMEALSCMEMAQTAIAEGKLPYARTLLAQAKAAGEQTPYYTEPLRRQWLLLQFEAGASAAELAPQLPSEDPALMLLATAAIEKKDIPVAAGFLDAMTHKTERWHLLRGTVFEEQGSLDDAIAHYLHAGEGATVYAALERCYLAKEDYKQAYFYACKRR